MRQNMQLPKNSKTEVIKTISKAKASKEAPSSTSKSLKFRERSLSCVSIEYHSLKFNLSGKKISSWETVTAQFGIGIFHFAVICFIAQKTNLNKAFSLVKAPLVLVYFLT